MYQYVCNSRAKPEIYCYDRVEQRSFTKNQPIHHKKALVLVNPTVVEIFYQELTTPSYKNHSFGHSYSTRNLLPGFFEPLTSTERLSTVSSPFLSNIQRTLYRFVLYPYFIHTQFSNSIWNMESQIGKAKKVNTISENYSRIFEIFNQ